MAEVDSSPSDLSNLNTRSGEQESVEPRRQFRLYQLFIALTAAGAVLAIGTQLSAPLGAFIGAVLLATAFHWHVRGGRLSLMAILGVSCVMAMLWLLSPQIDPSPLPFQRAQCSHNLRQLAIALNNYQYKHGSFPPAYVADANGRPLHSWRVLLLPFLGEDALYRQYHFDEPWNSPNNMQVAQAAAHHFRCPIAAGGKQVLVTQYVAIIGPETMWPGAVGRNSEDVTRGLSSTILLIEWPESDIIWHEPRDIPLQQLAVVLNPMRKTATDKHRHDDRINIVNGDASTTFLPLSTTVRELQALATAAGSEKTQQ
jgi:hypothetical protein